MTVNGKSPCRLPNSRCVAIGGHNYRLGHRLAQIISGLCNTLSSLASVHMTLIELSETVPPSPP